MSGTTSTWKKQQVKKLTGKQIVANSKDPNSCYYDGKSNIFNLREVRKKYCTQCGAPCVLRMRKAPVISHCDKHGAELVEVRQICSERNTWRNRLRQAFFIGYSHTNDHALTIHKDLAYTVTVKG